MKLIRAPIDMIAVFHKNEPPEPVRFRYQGDGKMWEIKVDKVVDLERRIYGNTMDYTYTCKSVIGRRQRVYEIRYNGQEVRWELYRTH